MGDPLAHGQKRFVHGISSDRLAGLASLPVAEAKDEEVSEAAIGARDSTEGDGLAGLDAVLVPQAHDLGIGGAGLASGGLGGPLEDSAEVSCEAGSGGR